VAIVLRDEIEGSMKTTWRQNSRIDSGMIILLSLAGVKLIIHLYTNAFAGYGIFRDELYYLACASHLDLGYVDHPPFSIYILAIWRALFGDSVFAIRLFPALAGAATVFMSGLIARKLGGGKFAILTTALSVIFSPILLAMNTVYTMNCIDILLWSIIAYLLLLMIRDDRPRYWILLGFLIGIGLLNKISMAWLAFGIFAGFLLTGKRKAFITPWPYISALIALGLFSPFIVWNITHDFAHLDFIRTAVAEKYAGVTLADFVMGQFLMMSPLSVIIWLAGIYYLLIHKDGKEFRILGIAVTIVTLILMVNGHSKPEYLSPTIPISLAAGAVLLGKILRGKFVAWLRIAIPALIALIGIIAAPIVLPILPVETFIKYTRTLGFSMKSYEGLEVTELHQFYADMFGWENMARTVSDVYLSLPPEERSTTIIFATNYGEAGAIDYFRKKYPLPAVFAPHNSYWIWGKDLEDKNIRTIIFIGHKESDAYRYADETTLANTIKSRYAIDYENNRPVYILRKLKVNVHQLRSMFRNFI